MIGQAVMDGSMHRPCRLYPFRHVYKDFTEPGDFADIAEKVGEQPAPDSPDTPNDKLL